MTKNPEVVWGVIASMYVGNVMLLILNLPLVGIWANPRIPYGILAPLVLVFCLLGTYGTTNSVFDSGTLVAFGVLGYLLKKKEFPLAPVVIAFILGSDIEMSLRRSLTISHGELNVFLTARLPLP